MKQEHFNFLRWMPVAGSVALVALIVIISAKTIQELNEAMYWRKHTFQVILEAQADEDDLIHAQSHMTRYVASGTPSLLIEYQNDTNSEVQEFKKLADLTRDNPQEQQRLKELDAAVRAVFEYDNRVIGLFARQGSEAALKMEGKAASILDNAAQDLEEFKEGEKTLLDKRDAKEQADFHKATRRLILGSVAAAVLLVLANYVASREMGRRRRAETKQLETIEELQKTLAEVKTLSGLIPICAWCKNVRSDQGFWHSVEHYVSTHTDAKFSHGVCPGCAEKWVKDQTIISEA